MLADEGELVEVVFLETINSQSIGSVRAAYIQQLLQGVDDLVGLCVAKDVDYLSMLCRAFWVYYVPQCVGLDWGIDMLSRRLPPRLVIHDGLQPEVFGVGLALDIGGDTPLEQFLVGGRQATGAVGE